MWLYIMLQIGLPYLLHHMFVAIILHYCKLNRTNQICVAPQLWRMADRSTMPHAMYSDCAWWLATKRNTLFGVQMALHDVNFFCVGSTMPHNGCTALHHVIFFCLGEHHAPQWMHGPPPPPKTILRGEGHATDVVHGAPPRILFANYIFVSPKASKPNCEPKTLIVNLNPTPRRLFLHLKFSARPSCN